MLESILLIGVVFVALPIYILCTICGYISNKATSYQSSSGYSAEDAAELRQKCFLSFREIKKYMPTLAEKYRLSVEQKYGFSTAEW